MDILLKAIPIAIPVILVILIFLMGYVKAPPDVIKAIRSWCFGSILA